LGPEKISRSLRARLNLLRIAKEETFGHMVPSIPWYFIPVLGKKGPIFGQGNWNFPSFRKEDYGQSFPKGLGWVGHLVTLKGRDLSLGLKKV